MTETLPRTPDPVRSSPPISAEERRLIDEAIAAGRVTHVPEGITSGSDTAHLYMLEDVSRHGIGAAVLASIASAKVPVTPWVVLGSVHRLRVSPPGLGRLDTMTIKATLEMLVARGYASRHAPGGKGRGAKEDRYLLTPDAPRVELVSLRRRQDAIRRRMKGVRD